MARNEPWVPPADPTPDEQPGDAAQVPVDEQPGDAAQVPVDEVAEVPPADEPLVLAEAPEAAEPTFATLRLASPGTASFEGSYNGERHTITAAGEDVPAEAVDGLMQQAAMAGIVVVEVPADDEEQGA